MQMMQPPEMHISTVTFDCPVLITHADFERAEAQTDHFTFMNNDAKVMENSSVLFKVFGVPYMG